MGSRFIADSYAAARLLPTSAPVHVLPYGVPDPQIGDARGAGGPLRFGYIGALLPHKGVHVAVEAFASIDGRDAQLHIWGGGDDPAYRARLAASVRDGGSVTFHGVLAEAEKQATLRTLDVLIVPSIGLESFGLVAREAMAQGVPVLASRRGALIELFEPGQGGDYFAAGDATELATWVSRLIAQPEQIARWRSAILPVTRVAAHAEALDRIYESLIGK
jgi:glycosyltransferase involved in cell wall biosynthesis